MSGYELSRFVDLSQSDAHNIHVVYVTKYFVILLSLIVALSVNNVYYVWGKSGDQLISRQPKETEFKSIDDIFIYYIEITQKTLDFDNDVKSLNGKE
jgi:hypothetical protein